MKKEEIIAKRLKESFPLMSEEEIGKASKEIAGDLEDPGTLDIGEYQKIMDQDDPGKVNLRIKDNL